MKVITQVTNYTYPGESDINSVWEGGCGGSGESKWKESFCELGSENWQ